MKKLKLILFIISLISLEKTQAQDSVNCAGGNATGSSGKLGYSIGQITYNQHSNGTYFVTQGIQQPYDVWEVLSVENTENIKLKLTAFPNPTTNYLTLSFEEKSNAISYQLFDASGKLLQSKSDLQNRESVPMENLNSGSYFLKISEKNNTIKTFKIIKN